ncbi:MAG: tRNA (adenosine(37)-N6)-threonylcarbamoyltransferase complex ATPase subunit type 1 TsaE [Chromatiaceae bacterium]
MIALRLEGEDAQVSFGRRVAAHLPCPCVILLKGELGTGKTTLVRGVLRGLGYTGTVRSPTYTLLEPYELGGRRLFHLDLYRLGDPRELEFLGLGDLLDQDSILLVEWPERAAGALPTPDVEIRIGYARQGRDLKLQGHSPAGELLLTRLAGDHRGDIRGGKGNL